MICGIHVSAKRMNGKCIYCRKAELTLLKIIEDERNFKGRSWFSSKHNRQALDDEQCSSDGYKVLANDRKRELEKLQRGWYLRWHKNVEELRAEL
jgi:hypothetical protein